MSEVPIRHNQTLVQWVMRRFKFDVRQFDADLQKNISDGNIDRASGDVICPHCGNKYYDHPQIKDVGGLVVTCDWKVYKL